VDFIQKSEQISEKLQEYWAVQKKLHRDAQKNGVENLPANRMMTSHGICREFRHQEVAIFKLLILDQEKLLVNY
jgi:hypothetical protein